MTGHSIRKLHISAPEHDQSAVKNQRATLACVHYSHAVLISSFQLTV